MLPAQLAAFVEAASATLDPLDGESFWSCREAFRGLLASGFLSELLSVQLEYCLCGDGELIQAGTGWSGRVALPNGMQLDILLVEPGSAPDELIGYPSHVLMGFSASVSGAALTLGRYRHGASYRNDLFDQEEVPLREPDQILRMNDVADVAAGRELFRFLSADAPITVVMLQSKPLLQFAWQYDVDSLRPARAICPDPATFRLFYMTRLLKEIPAPGNIESLLRISHHRSHFLRWSALQALFANDQATALARLEEAADDPHPRIFTAARNALGRLAGRGA